MSEREPDGPDSITQPLPYIIENELEYLFVSFNDDIDPFGRSVILGIIKGQKDEDISRESGRTIGAVQAKMKLFKKGLRRRGNLWPHDRMDIIYSLQSLGDITIERGVK